MMKLIYALFLTLVGAMTARAQAEPTVPLPPVIVFVEQDFTRIPGLREYVVSVTSPNVQIPPVHAMAVMLAATHQSIRPYFPVNLQAYVAQYNQRSWLRWVGVIGEMGGWSFVSGTALETVKIKERGIKAAITLTSGAITIARTVYDREYKQLAIPADALPVYDIGLAAGEMKQFAVWATP